MVADLGVPLDDINEDGRIRGWSYTGMIPGRRRTSVKLRRR
jgi:hypothetical protein